MAADTFLRWRSVFWRSVLSFINIDMIETAWLTTIKVGRLLETTAVPTSGCLADVCNSHQFLIGYTILYLKVGRLFYCHARFNSYRYCQTTNEKNGWLKHSVSIWFQWQRFLDPLGALSQQMRNWPLQFQWATIFTPLTISIKVQFSHTEEAQYIFLFHLFSNLFISLVSI